MNHSTSIAIRSRLKDYWQRLESRNQRALKLASMALLAVLVWQIGIEPALVQRQKLHAQLPRLRDEAEVVLGLLEEAAALQKNQPQQQIADNKITSQLDTITMTAKGIKESLQAKGAGEVDTHYSDGMWRIQIEPIGFANLHGWLTKQSAVGWQVQQIDIERIGSLIGETIAGGDKVRAVVHVRLARTAS